MAISVSKFKNSCLDVIRRLEATGQSVSITRPVLSREDFEALR
jgi:hypothetical protein